MGLLGKNSPKALLNVFIATGNYKAQAYVLRNTETVPLIIFKLVITAFVLRRTSQRRCTGLC